MENLQAARITQDTGKAQTPEAVAEGFLAIARFAYDRLIRAATEIATHGRFNFTDDTVGFAELSDYFTTRD